jgi:hypothetical protein
VRSFRPQLFASLLVCLANSDGVMRENYSIVASSDIIEIEKDEITFKDVEALFN